MKKSLKYRVNEQIRSPSLRVIAADGKQVGVMTKDKALAQAKKENLSLIEIAPTAKPPVAKIVDLGKFLYQEEKKVRREHVKSKGGDVKEVRFSPFIAENDYLVRFKKVQEFLREKDKVRLVVVFKGPQMRSKSFGFNLLNRIVGELGETISVDMKPKFLGKHLIMVVSPVANHAKTKNT